ncbi:MAG: NYN domain-containing protein [Acidobacteriota bacterium]
MLNLVPLLQQGHQAYVAALNHVGVTAILGNFKSKTSICPNCQREVVHHEEKETDVNIALHLLLGAFQDSYDRALLIGRDSDLAPAVRMVVNEFPNKQVRVIAPIGGRRQRGSTRSGWEG